MSDHDLAQLMQDLDRPAPVMEIVPPRPLTAPPEISPAAFHGLAGDVVRAIDPTTEADRIAVLVTLLACVGNAVGYGPCAYVGEYRLGTNIFVGIVGNTASGKGMSWAPVSFLMRLADPNWHDTRVTHGGTQSGEGIAHAIRDPQPDKGDAGVEDKRLLVKEEELAHIFKVASRTGNNITTMLRKAYDAHPLQTMAKSSIEIATNPHVSFIGHITQHELVSHMTTNDLANGFANRFLWVSVRRSKSLPNPPRLDPDEVNALAKQLREIVEVGQHVQTMHRTKAAEDRWSSVYESLVPSDDLVGNLTARGRDIVTRLSMIYALLDRTNTVDVAHLEAALALWTYGEESARRIFGTLTGDDVADRILELLADGPITRTDVSNELGRHVSRQRLDAATDMLNRTDRIIVTRTPNPQGNGRPVLTYRMANVVGNAKEAKKPPLDGVISHTSQRRALPIIAQEPQSPTAEWFTWGSA